ncbi:MAG: hypothetical protein EBQ76_03965 [Betaproteobacteria bacterium]|nr:hypothetical protein [Betaproteobacteria bacterium]
MEHPLATALFFASGLCVSLIVSRFWPIALLWFDRAHGLSRLGQGAKSGRARARALMVFLILALLLAGPLGLASSLLMSFSISVWIERWIYSRGQARRLNGLRKQLPDLCDFLASALRAGMSLRAAVDQAQSQISDPMKEGLSALQNAQRLGTSLEDALDRWARASGLEGIRDLAFCLRVSSQSGGSVSDSIQSLGKSLRQRNLIEAKAEALSAQGRLQALVMMFIPVVLLVVTSLLDPNVSDFFFKQEVGQRLLIVILFLEVFGYRWIKKLIKVH